MGLNVTDKINIYIKSNEEINQALNKREKSFNLLKTLDIGDKYAHGAVTKIYYHRNNLSNYDILKNYNSNCKIIEN